MTIEKKSYFERRIRPINDNELKYDESYENNNNNYNNNNNSNYNKQHQQLQYIQQSQQRKSSSGGIIDEDQLERTFQEIVNSINLDDDDEDSDGESSFLTKIKEQNYGNNNGSEEPSITNNFSRSNYHHSHHSLLPEFNSIFGGPKASFNVAVGSGSEVKSSSSSAATTGLGRSFLDDDWFPRTRPMTPSSSTSTNNSSTSSPNSLLSSSSSSSPSHSAYKAPPPGLASNPNGIINNNNNIIINQQQSNNGFTSFMSSPPSDYVCKLCSYGGHWMKDCKLYEPRPGIASSSSSTISSSSFASFKSASSNSSAGLSSTSSSPSLTGFNNSRSLLPPGNYVCRLCNVAGHWIDQCSKFQPKHEGTNGINVNNSNLTSNNLLNSCSSGSSNILPPMLGPGPTPNYRPPAYLSKPVPSNYICNLCNRPGHWIQQCSEFTPIINHKPKW